MIALSDGSVPLKRADLIVVEADDQMLVHYPGMRDPLSLNGSAQAILELCDGTRTIAQLGHYLAEQYDYPVEVLTSDVKCTIAQLDKFGVVSLQGPAVE